MTVSLAGSYLGVAANFGAPLPEDTPIVGQLALTLDDDQGASEDPYDACDDLLNGPDLNGNIAVIRRGECQFGFKILSAQNQGAIAVIIVNNVPGGPIVHGTRRSWRSSNYNSYYDFSGRWRCNYCSIACR